MNLIYLSVLTLLLAASTTLLVTKKDASRVLSDSKVTTNNTVNENYSALPILYQSISPPNLSAESVIAVDVDSGVTLFERNPDSLVLPASTTKIITALVALDYYSEEDVLTVSNVNVEGRKMNLVREEKMKFIDLLYGLLVFSANDAAEVIAANYPGGRDMFIAAMNLKAQELGLEKSKFSNPSGLEGSGHLTTARDLIRAAQVAMKNEIFAEAVSTKSKQVKSVDGRFTHNLRSTNELLGAMDGVVGIKTGWTENAKENLVTFVRRDNKNVVVAVLSSQDRFGETTELIDWIFGNYKWEEVSYSP